MLNAAELIEIEKGIGENKFSQMCKYVSVLMGNWDVHNASFGKREQPKHKAVKQYYLFLNFRGIVHLCYKTHKASLEHCIGQWFSTWGSHNNFRGLPDHILYVV